MGQSVVAQMRLVLTLDVAHHAERLLNMVSRADKHVDSTGKSSHLHTTMQLIEKVVLLVALVQS